MSEQLETAILAGGCFWGMQDLIRKMPGVVSTRVGYSGGDVAHATYRNHGTHAEAIEIVFNPSVLSYRELLEFFFQIHDPSTPNRQGNDSGPQYRSAVFYHNDAQKQKAEFYKQKLEEEKVFANAIVTEISPLINWYPAENYHQNYFLNNPDQAYCTYVVRPKVEKFHKAFAHKLKEGVK